MKRVLKFYGEWCGPCKVVEKNLAAAGIEHESIDVDKNEELTAKYGVRNLPTTVVLGEDDKEIKRFVGIFKVDDLKELL